MALHKWSFRLPAPLLACSSPSYSANSNYGITFEQAMRKIHAITADGKIVTGIEVFRCVHTCSC
jgi:hypothetical protein